MNSCGSPVAARPRRYSSCSVRTSEYLLPTGTTTEMNETPAGIGSDISASLLVSGESRVRMLARIAGLEDELTENSARPENERRHEQQQSCTGERQRKHVLRRPCSPERVGDDGAAGEQERQRQHRKPQCGPRYKARDRLDHEQ